LKPFYVYVPHQNTVKLAIDKCIINGNVAFIAMDNIGIFSTVLLSECYFLKFLDKTADFEFEKFPQDLLEKKREIYNGKKH